MRYNKARWYTYNLYVYHRALLYLTDHMTLCRYREYNYSAHSEVQEVRLYTVHAHPIQLIIAVLYKGMYIILC